MQGYSLGLLYHTVVADVNECLTGDDDCEDDMRCHNTKGSWVCLCKAGTVRMVATDTCGRASINPTINQNSCRDQLPLHGREPDPELKMVRRRLLEGAVKFTRREA